MEEKYYRLTKVKAHKNKDWSEVKSGSTMTGYLSEEIMPKKGRNFIFISDFGFNRGLTTSKVIEVDKNVEPGVTFIETENSIYKLEELADDSF